MKLGRAISIGLSASLGLVLVIAIALWRNGRGVIFHELAGSLAMGRDLSSVRLPNNSTNAQIAGLRESQMDSPTATISTKVETTPFLVGLATTLESIQSEPDVLEREKHLETLANEIATADLPTAVESLNNQNPSELSRNLSLRLIRRWANNEPEAAADWVSRIPLGSTRQEGLNAVAIVWANQSLSDAVEWTRQLPEEAERQKGLIKVAYEAARSQPIEALRLMIELPTNEGRDDSVAYTASQWATRNPEDAAEWGRQIADEALRERVLAEIATAWGDTDPVAAATLGVKSLMPGKRQDDAVVGIVQRWVQKKPEEAAAWVAGFPEGTLRNTSLGELVGLWADQNPEQAANWLNGVAAGASRDIAVGAYVSKITGLYPELAARWVEGIEDETLRDREKERVGEAWMGRDATTARDWITASSLPESTKERLLGLKLEW